MADRYQDRPFPSADQARGESDPLAELARLIGQNDPSGAAAKPAPRPLQSRANVRPQQYDSPEEQPDAPPSPPAWMQRARHETPLPPPPPLPQEYDDEPEYRVRAGAGASRCIATRPSRRSTRPAAASTQHDSPAARPQQDYMTSSLSSNTPTSRSRTRRAMTTRCMGGWKPASTTISAIRPIRTIPTPIRASMRKSPRRRSARAA